MKWLSRFLAFLLTIALFGAVLSLVFDRTLLSAGYLDAKFKQQDIYTRVATDLPTEIAKQGGAEARTALPDLQKVITPELVQAKVETALKEFERYYKSGGPAPTIDLSDVVAKARAEGLQIPAGKFDKPVVVAGIGQTRGAVQGFESAKLGMILGVALLTILLGVVCWRRQNFRPLARALAITGGLVSIIAIALGLAPGIIDSRLHFDLKSDQYLAMGHDVALQAFRDLAVTFGVIGGVLILLGVGLWLALHFEEDRWGLGPDEPKTHPETKPA